MAAEHQRRRRLCLSLVSSQRRRPPVLATFTSEICPNVGVSPDSCTGPVNEGKGLMWPMIFHSSSPTSVVLPCPIPGSCDIEERGGARVFFLVCSLQKFLYINVSEINYHTAKSSWVASLSMFLLHIWWVSWVRIWLAVWGFRVFVATI